MNPNTNSQRSAKPYDRHLNYSEVAKLITHENVNERSYVYAGTVLHSSALEVIDRVKRLELCLKYGADVNIQNLHPEDPFHSTALHLIIANESIDDAKQFIALTKKYQKKIDYNVQDRQGKTTLVLACKMRNEKAALMLLAEKAIGCELDVNLADIHGNTALHYACAYGMVKVAEMLVQYNANINLKNLKNRAPIDMTKATAEEIHGWLADVDIDSSRDEMAAFNLFSDKSFQEFITTDGKVIEIPACKANIPKLKESLDLDLFDSEVMFRTKKPAQLSKADKRDIIQSVKNYTGRSVLQLCLDERNKAWDFMLKQKDIQVGFVFRNAAFNNQLDELQIILQQHPTVLNEVGMPSLKSALHFAASKNHIGICTALLEKNADATLVDAEGNTALHYACVGGHIVSIRLLLEKNCNVEQVNKENKTAWQILTAFLDKTSFNQELKADLQKLFSENRSLVSGVAQTSLQN